MAVANPQQLELLSEVLEAYSMAFGVAEPEKRSYLADLLIVLFERGARTKTELASALEREIARGFLR